MEPPIETDTILQGLRPCPVDVPNEPLRALILHTLETLPDSLTERRSTLDALARIIGPEHRLHFMVTGLLRQLIEHERIRAAIKIAFPLQLPAPPPLAILEEPESLKQ